MNYRRNLFLFGWLLWAATASAIPPADWAEQLESGRETERSQAQRQLIKLGPSAVPVLTNAMSHKDKDVRCSAAEAIGKIGRGTEAAIPKLADALSDSSPEVRANAAEALGRIPGSGNVAIPVLMKCVKASISAGKGKKRSPEELPHAFSTLTSRDLEIAVLRRSIEAFGNIGHESKIATSLLVAIVSDKNLDRSVRTAAEESLPLVDADPDIAIPVLLAALSKEEDDKEVRGEAANALGRFAISGENVITALMDSAGDAEHVVRIKSVSALGRIGASAKSALPLLLEILASDKSPAIRQQAVFAVSQIGFGDQEAVLPALIAAMEKDDEVMVAAASVIGSWGEQGAPAIPSLVNALRSGNYRVREVAARSLGQIGPRAKEAVPSLMKQFNGLRNSNRLETAYALWQIEGYEPGRKYLLDALKNADKEKVSERARTISLLGTMTPPPKEAVPLLVVALKDPETFIRKSAAFALRSIDPEAAEKAGVSLKK